MEKPRMDKAGDAFCSDCAPRLEPEEVGPEVDAPLSCKKCGRLLEFSLTRAGVKEVLELAAFTVQHWSGMSLETLHQPGSYYHGSRAVQPLIDVVRDVVRHYTLPREQAGLLQQLLYLADGKQSIVTEDDGDPN